MAAKHRIETAELEPACEELAALGRDRVKAACLVTRLTTPPPPPRPRLAWASSVVQVLLMSPDQQAAPESLHPRTARAAKKERPPIGIVARLSVGEGLLAEEIEAVVQSRAAIPTENIRGSRSSPPSSHQPSTPSAFSPRWASHHQRPAAGSSKSMKRWPS
jgi:hypothetical protein